MFWHVGYSQVTLRNHFPLSVPGKLPRDMSGERTQISRALAICSFLSHSQIHFHMNFALFFFSLKGALKIDLALLMICS